MLSGSYFCCTVPPPLPPPLILWPPMPDGAGKQKYTIIHLPIHWVTCYLHVYATIPAIRTGKQHYGSVGQMRLSGRCGCRASGTCCHPVAALPVLSYCAFLTMYIINCATDHTYHYHHFIVQHNSGDTSNIPPTPTVQLSTFTCAAQQKESEFWNDEWGLQCHEMLVYTMHPLSPCVQEYSSNWATSWLVHDDETPEKKMFTKAHRT